MHEHICTLNPVALQKAESRMRSAESIIKMSDFLKILADPTRLKIANALLTSELCVCDIAEILGMEHSAVSHQLAVLRKANIVNTRKEGKSVYYSLSDEHIGIIFNITEAHISE